MTDFKPGTVARATIKRHEDVLALAIGDGYWAHDPIGRDDIAAPGQVADVRPLVVLDLEHPDLIVRALRDAASKDDHNAAPLRGIADQIADQTKPPKPVEPKGLGAVVEDSDHRKWVRRSNIPGDFPWDLATDRECCGVGWSQIDVVRVLSEGVAS